MRASGAWVVVIAVLAGGCTSHGDDVTVVERGSSTTSASAPADTSPAPTPASGSVEPPTPIAPVSSDATPWSRALAAYDPETASDPAAALSLFELAFGPLASTPASTTPVTPSGASGDVTFAYRAVLGVWDQLSEAQHVAINMRLQAPGSKPGGFVSPARPSPDRTELEDALSAVAAQMRAAIATKIGDFTGTMTVKVGSDLKGQAKTTLAYATDGKVSGPKFSGQCAIYVLTNSVGLGAQKLMAIMAHEVVHCFQFAAYPDLAAFGRAPGWVVEGGANWIAAEIADIAGLFDGFWTDYLTTPATALTTRKYDGIGFWAHLAETGVDPWTTFRTVWAASGGTPGAFSAAGATSPAFLDTWGSGLLRDSSRGPAWDTTGRHITADMAPAKALVVPAKGEVDVSAAAYATGMFQMSTEADIVEFRTTGHARVSDGRVDVVVSGDTFCTSTSGEGCRCPDDPDDIPPAPLSPDAIVALTGGPDGTTLSAIGETLEVHCKRPVQAFVDRPAGPGMMAGRIFELTSCTGAYGHWTGVLRDGGVTDGGAYNVPFQDLPIDVTLSAASPSAHTSVGNVLETPSGEISIQFELDISTDGHTLSVTGSATAENEVVGIDTGLGIIGTGLPIVPAPEGACP